MQIGAAKAGGVSYLTFPCGFSVVIPGRPSARLSHYLKLINGWGLLRFSILKETPTTPNLYPCVQSWTSSFDLLLWPCTSMKKCWVMRRASTFLWRLSPFLFKLRFLAWRKNSGIQHQRRESNHSASVWMVVRAFSNRVARKRRPEVANGPHLGAQSPIPCNRSTSRDYWTMEVSPKSAQRPGRPSIHVHLLCLFPDCQAGL